MSIMMASAWQKLFSPQKWQFETLHLTIGFSWLIFYHLDIYCLRSANRLFPAEMPDDDMLPYPQFQSKKTQKNRHKGGFVQFVYKLKM